MAQQAWGTGAGHIIDAVDAAAAVMSQIESQVGGLDGPALEEMSERFVSSLSVRMRTICLLPTHWAEPMPPARPHIQAAHAKLREEIVRRSEARPRDASIGASRDRLQLLAVRAELTQSHVRRMLDAFPDSEDGAR
jgi:hypothetical protein